MGLLERTYIRLPVCGQQVAVTAYGLYWHWLRFGPGYRRHLREYLSRERYRDNEWRRWQCGILHRLLKIAELVAKYQGPQGSNQTATQ